MRRTIQIFSGLAIAGLIAVNSGYALDTEWEETNPYYEDDAWYDITEWFDGNDYNPINEFPGDDDSDWTTGYGYDTTNQDDNWFYDYYDDDYSTYDYDSGDSEFSYSYGYWDLDGDGLYEQSYYLSDPDGDGTYTGYFATFDSDSQKQSNQKTKRQSQNKQAQSGQRKSSQFAQFSGEIRNMKTVNVKNTKHQVVHVKASGGETQIVDLGRKDALKANLQKGARIQATGPAAQVGDKTVILAQQVTIDGKTHKIDRSRGEFSGQIVSTKEVTVRGNQHLLAMVETDGKKRAVDLGAADDLKELNLKKGQKVTVSGPPVKVKDTFIIMAHKVEQNGKSQKIDRKFSQKQNQGSKKSS